jgi:hypothetical protein
MTYYLSRGYKGNHRRTRRQLLALIYALATVFVLLGLIVAAFNARSEEHPVPANSVESTSPEPTITASPRLAGLGSFDQTADGGEGGEEAPAGPVEQVSPDTEPSGTPCGS